MLTGPPSDEGADMRQAEIHMKKIVSKRRKVELHSAHAGCSRHNAG
jgi:hypothetical protein